ncbi:MAG: hypothetical protein JWP35_4036 [Caulobacter sp.]|nr:hypothetical protein [Caulobacter sp.]
MTDAAPPSLADVPKAIATPCIQVCIIDGQSSLCLGCYRTLKEVATWGRMSEQERAEIMAGLRDRRARIAPEKLGLA